MHLEGKLTNALNSGNSNRIDIVFEDIFNEYSKLVGFIIFKYIDEVSVVEELVIDVFIKFYKTIFKTKINSIKAYLVKIAKNTAIDYLRKNKNIIINDDELVLCITDNEHHNNEYYELIDSMKIVLTDEEINIILLHAINDYSFKEISEKLNLPITTISSKYYRALKKYKNGVKL